MISKDMYHVYLTHLLKGDRRACIDIVQRLLNNGIALETLYVDLFQKSLYRVGKLWELNEISVAREHLATTLTESLMDMAYPHLPQIAVSAQKVVVACTANELHQVGGRMAADMFQFHGWDAHYIGADNPLGHLLTFVDEEQPDLVGLSCSMYFNLPQLIQAIESLRENFNHMDLCVGGQVFNWGGEEVLSRFKNIEYIEDLNALSVQLGGDGR